MNDEHKTHDGPFSFGFGPMKLLEERRIHHLSKLFYRQVYWNHLPKARSLLDITR